MITDRLRITVLEANTGEILTRDLVVKEPTVIVNLSAPSHISFNIDQGQRFASAAGIDWKSWGQVIVPELETDQYGRICLGAQIISDGGVRIDPESGDLVIDAVGFMGYPKGIPWLENFNPIAVDPAEVIQRVWAHLQSFPHCDMGVQVLPSSTGTQMLPGHGFDGSILSFDFFALFIRAADFNDCGDTITGLARDLPLDMFEEVSWNEDRTELKKVLRLAYPLGGVQQDYLAFRLGENVINCELAEELEIEPVSDVIIRGWLPGKVYTSQLTNADPSRFRRVVLEEDASISSTERAAAWAKRKLTRRNIPKSFSKIQIDPNHPHAPFGSFWVGDSIFIEAPNYPWVGDIQQWHRIVSITYKEGEPFMELGVKVEGAFNYDPIEYNPDWEEEPTEDPNLLSNGYFSKSLRGWYARKGQWFRVAQDGYTSPGCVRVDCDDFGERLESEKVVAIPGETLDCQVRVRYQEIETSGSPNGTFAISAIPYANGGAVGPATVIDSIDVDGTGGYTLLRGDYEVPEEANEITLNLVVANNVSGGISFWDDARILR
ncbi:minor tail protein [Mycobacterium phage Patience]|uniref:Minor tail protein n=1 Tax=Mycobacterium phage Patience TaxID=1074308 RepID=G1JWE7_9CAUD|nr:minor tail protein [Mycobacterium phage Patience]AEL97945.1 hypothetical protein PATIENCE_36 [Mycobacterium phage Patience]